MDAVGELERLRLLIATQEAQLRETAAAADAATSQAELAFARTFETAELGDAPDFEAQTGERLEVCGRLHRILEQWVGHGACVPFTVEDVRTHTQAGAGLEELLRSLLGGAWALWVSGGAGASQVVPRQAALHLHRALERLGRRCAELEPAGADAAGSYDVLAASHKRRRTRDA